MEKMIRELFYGADRGSARRRSGALTHSMLLPSAALFLFSALMGSYTPFEGLSPFGTACVIAAWYAGANPYFAAAGAALGYALAGEPAYALTCLLMGAGIFALNRQGSIMRVYRLLIGFAGECVSFLFMAAVFKLRLLFLFGAATVSVLAGIVMGSGFRAFGSLSGGRALTDTELLTLSAAAGLATLAVRNFNLWGVSPAMIFAGACALFASYRLGAPAVACAVTIGAGRALASGGDMHFIAVLAAMTLTAASIRSLGKWASLAGFLLTGVFFTAVVRGLFVFGYIELAAVGAIFALVPERLYMPGAVKEELREGAKPDPGYSRLQLKVASLCDVLSELARLGTERDGRILDCVSAALRRALSSGGRTKAKFLTECGHAGSAKGGSEASGDSCAVRELDGKLLMALSDGMGSGKEAAGESRAALGLVCDLMSVGFDVDEAAGLSNELLIKRGRGEMYATLDLMLLDLEEGEARLSKHGAPSSYVLRDGRLLTLYSEGLPVGIIENAGSSSGSFRLKEGDTVIMMTDGVTDALGSGLLAAIADNVLSFGDPELAARSLIDAAKKAGGRDDMTVIVTRLKKAA